MGGGESGRSIGCELEVGPVWSGSAHGVVSALRGDDTDHGRSQRIDERPPLRIRGSGCINVPRPRSPRDSVRVRTWGPPGTPKDLYDLLTIKCGYAIFFLKDILNGN